jgi:peptide/nickel transport system permease protein
MQYVIQRLLAAIPTVIGVAVIVFVILRLLPGDPAELMLQGAVYSRRDVEETRQTLGLNRPAIVQLGSYLADAARGDLGRSFVFNTPVTAMIREQFPATLQLALAALLVGGLVGVTMGVLAAYFRNSILDNVCMVFALGGVSMPSFWFGILLIFVFSLQLGWFPATGTGGLDRLVLPALTLGLILAGSLARLTRSSMLEVLSQDYVTTARSKGLRERVVVVRHALKNALIPVVTLLGIQFGNLLAGSVIVETIFSRQGIGRMLIQAINTKDVPVVQGVVLLIATLYVLINLLVDISYGLLDPRVRTGR